MLCASSSFVVLTKVLKALGRIHDRDQAVAMIEHAKAIGFNRLNVDLMHGTPNQTPEIAREDLNIIRDLEVSHLSWYQLTIEPNTAFYSKPPALPEEDTLEVTEEMGSEIINAMGLKHYEVSAFAKPGEEARHTATAKHCDVFLIRDPLGAGKEGNVSKVVSECHVRSPVC